MDVVLLAHTAATLALVGLIWTVQVVHYPLFSRIGTDAFPGYHAAHMRLMTYVVAPLMLAELATAGWLAWSPPTPALAGVAVVGAALVTVNWVSTAIVQVPLHRTLEDGLDERVVGRLVRSNWIRTVAWTARGAVALAMLWRA